MAKETVQLVLDVDQKKAHESMKAISSEIVEIKKGFEGLKKGSKEYEDQMKKLEAATKRWTETASIGDLTKEMNKLNREIKQLIPGSDAFIQKSKQLSIVRDRFREVNNELKGIQQNANPSILQKMFGSLTDAAKKFGAAAIAMFAVDKIIDYAGQIAATITEIGKLRGTTQQLTGETGNALTDLVSRTKSLADTFGQDFNEVLKITNTLAKEFGITQKEASELIQKGFLAGANASGEFINILREYPAQLEAVGFTAEESIAIITQQVKSGVFSDKGIDAIKEAGLRLREFTKPAADALDAIGLSSTQIQKDLANGTKNVRDVINDVSERLKQLPANSKPAQQAIADIFGGAGEDAGRKFLENLSNAKLGIDGLIDTNNVLVQQQIRQLEVQQRTNEAWQKVSIILQPVISFLGFVTSKIKLLVVDGFVTVLEFFQYFGDNIAIFRAKVVEGVNSVINTLNKFTGALGKVTGLNLQIGTIGLDESSAELQAKLAEKKHANYITRKAEMDAAAAARSITETTTTEDKKSKIKTDAAKKAAKEIENIEKGSISALRAELSKLQKDLEQTADLSVKVKLLADISQLQTQLDTAETQLREARNGLSGLHLTANIDNIDATQVEGLLAQVTLTEEQIAELQKKFQDQRYADLQQSTTKYLTEVQKRKEAELQSIQATQAALGGLAGGFSALADGLGEASEAAKIMRTISLALAAAEQVAAVAAGIKAITIAAGQPFPASIVAIASTVGAIGGAIGAFTALIKSVSSTPKLAKGGFSPEAGRGGLPTGASHAAGGIGLYDTSGNKLGEMEGGEPILSIATYRNNKDLIDRLLYASMFQSGRKIFANGGFAPNQSLVSAAPAPANGNIYSNTELINQNNEIIELLRQNNNTKLVAVLSPKTFQEVQEEQSTFITRSRLS